MYIHSTVQLQYTIGHLFRNVTVADIQVLERRLLQTMDMIVAKRKGTVQIVAGLVAVLWQPLCTHTECWDLAKNLAISLCLKFLVPLSIAVFVDADMYFLNWRGQSKCKVHFSFPCVQFFLHLSQPFPLLRLYCRSLYFFLLPLFSSFRVRLAKEQTLLTPTWRATLEWTACGTCSVESAPAVQRVSKPYTSYSILARVLFHFSPPALCNETYVHTCMRGTT